MGGLNNLKGKKAAPFVKGGGRSKTHPNDAKGKKRKQALAVLRRAKGSDLATGVSGHEIDLDWANWNAAHKGQKNTASAKNTRAVVKTGKKTGISFGEIKAFKRSIPGATKGGSLGPKAQAALQARSQKAGHFRAKAILAAQSGDTAGAKKFQSLWVAHQAAARKNSKSAPGAPAAKGVQHPAMAANRFTKKSAAPSKDSRPAKIAPKFRLAAKNNAAHAMAVRTSRAG